MGAGRRAVLAIGALAACTGAGFGALPAAADSPLARITYSNGGRLFAIDADGSHRRQLTGPASPRGDRTADTYPTWAADGSELAFVRNIPRGRFSVSSQIQLANPSGHRQHPLTPLNLRASVYSPKFSPDGQRVVFARFRERSDGFVSAIVMINVDGTAQQTLAKSRLDQSSRTLVYVDQPTFTPDGSHVIYTRYGVNANGFFRSSLRLVGTDGSADQGFIHSANSADFSADGTKLAFTSDRDHNGSTCFSDECEYDTELYVANADGTSPLRLTDGRGHELGPDWSGDGTRITFESDRNLPGADRPEIYSIDSTGHCLTWLTNGTPDSRTPAWRPDPGASTDPGACGDASRAPLDEVTLDHDALSALPFEPLLLGPVFRTRLLSDVQIGSRSVFADYTDCDRFEPSECRPGAFLQQNSSCRKYEQAFLIFFGSQSLRLVRGALMTGDRHMTLVYSGRGVAQMDAQDPLEAARALRLVGDPSGEPLPHARLPRHFLKELRKQQAAVDSLGSVRAAADELGVPRRYLRDELNVLATLDRLGPIRGFRCKPKPPPILPARGGPAPQQTAGALPGVPAPVLQALRQLRGSQG